jgi:hypothetical protein
LEEALTLNRTENRAARFHPESAALQQLRAAAASDILHDNNQCRLSFFSEQDSGAAYPRF